MIILFQQKLPQKFSTTCYFRVGSLSVSCRVIIRYLFAAKGKGLSSREGSPVGLLGEFVWVIGLVSNGRHTRRSVGEKAVGVFRCFFSAL